MSIRECQGAVDWLLATYWPNGDAKRAQVRVERQVDVTLNDADRRLLETMYRCKRGAERQQLYEGNVAGFRKPDGSVDWSGADQSQLDALAYYTDKDAARMDRLHRASGLFAARPNPEKWDEIHYADGRTYGEGTIGTAVGGCRETYRDHTGRTADAEDSVAGAAPATIAEGPDELAQLRAALASAEAEVTRRGRVIDNLADVVHVQQTVIQAKQARLDVLEPYVAYVQDVVTRDEAECPSDDKVVLIGFVPWLQSYRAKQATNGESPTFALKYGAKVIGMHHKRFSKVLDRWSSPDPDAGAPWCKKVTRTRVPTGGGPDDWDSALEVTPWRETTQEVLRASLAYVPPPKPKKGGSAEATAHRWRRCKKHPTAPVTIQGRCSEGGELLGEVRISPDDFEALKSRFVLSEGVAPPVDAQYLSTSQSGIPDAEQGDDGLKVQPVDSDPTDELAARRNGHGPPESLHWRCACGCQERRIRDDGSGRCLKCGAVSVLSEVAG